MDYNQMEQKALQEYWDAIIKNNQGGAIPVTENGAIAHPNFNMIIDYLAEKEINAMGYLLGVKETGELSEESQNKKDEMIRVILEEIKMTPEERIAAHQNRIIDRNAYNLYEYHIQETLNKYNLYQAVCSKYGIEPHALYQVNEESMKL